VSIGEAIPGVRDVIVGPDLMANLRAPAERFRAELITDDVVAVRLPGDIKEVDTGDAPYGGTSPAGFARQGLP